MVSSCSQAVLTTSPLNLRNFDLSRLVALLVWVLLLFGVASAQNAADDKVEVVSGTNQAKAYGLGNSVRITGSVKEAMSLGGDVIVEGVVEGDVATIGGSVIQKAGSRIGGDVIVIGGSYLTDDARPNRSPQAKTIMYAGYEHELKQMMRNPTGLFSPRWTPTYLGTRLLVILFWFLVSLGFTAAMPNTISRGVARLQLTSLRVAAIGLIGTVVIFFGVPLALSVLPETIGVLVGLLALLFLIVAGVFGRVILYAATGRWLQRKYAPVGKSSEAVALLLGTTLWVLLTSLPYIWLFMAIFLLIISFGLALTARYRASWISTASATHG